MFSRRSLLLGALPAIKSFAAALQPDVRCLADPSQSYALYVPTTYKQEQAWPLLLCFDPRARGAEAAARFQAGAEEFGWIVAASNNSRNGPWELSNQALIAMSKDLVDRFAIDSKRIYTAGMSGGARVAMQVALSTGRVAGVVAASAGYPDNQPRKTLPFPVFASAGTEDFNWLEMKQLDADLKSPHRLRIFEGGHVWLPPELARDGIEFLELAAMRAGLRSKDPQLLQRLYGSRLESVGKLDAIRAYEAWHSLADDFEGLDPRATQAKAEAARLLKDKRVKSAAHEQKEEMNQELEARKEFLTLEANIADPSQRVLALEQLEAKLLQLGRHAKAANESAQRRIARRVGRGLSSSTNDPRYRQMLDAAGFGRAAPAR